MKNKDFDFIAKNINRKLVSRFVDAICDSGSRLDPLKDMTPLMKLYNRWQTGRKQTVSHI